MNPVPHEPHVETFIQAEVARGIRFDMTLIDLLASVFFFPSLLGGAMKIAGYFENGQVWRTAIPVLGSIVGLSYLLYRVVSAHWLSSRLVRQASFRQDVVELRLVRGHPLLTSQVGIRTAQLAKAPLGSMHRLGKLKLRKLVLSEGSVFIAEEWLGRLSAVRANTAAHPPHGT